MRRIFTDRKTPPPARVFLLVAKEAPVAVILRRKPSKTWHVIRWDLKTDTLTHGSWFNGKIYPLRCDLSWDGKYMAYLAMGSDAKTSWNGVCEPPFLKTVAEWDNLGTWNGGGVWMERLHLYCNLSMKSEVKLVGDWPNKMEFRALPTWKGEDLTIVLHRLYRDGFRPVIGGKTVDPLDEQFQWREEVRWKEEPVWACPRNGLTLTTQHVGWKGSRGYKGHLGVFGDEAGPGYHDRTGYIFRYELEGHPELLGPKVESASWTSTGDLIWSAEGCVFRLRKPRPGKIGEPEMIDLNEIERPPRRQKIETL